MAYTEDDYQKYLQRMQKANAVQKTGNALMQMGCAIMVIGFLAFVLLMVVIGALA